MAEGSSLLDQLERQWWELREHLGFKDDLTPILATLGVLVLTLVLLFLVFRTTLKGKKRDTILLLGLSGAGKTALFSSSTVRGLQLRDGSAHNGTVMSMEPNEGRFILNSETGQQKGKKGKTTKPVHIVDVPGHPRLKPKIEEFLPQASGIVFVVDALDFVPQVRPIAEYLYDVLTKELVVRKKIPVLLACNKMDKVTAHSVEFIRRQLEKEIEKLRTTRKSMSDVDLASEVVIGSQTGQFQFSQCINEICVSEASVLQGKIGTVEQFIREYVKP